MPSEEESNRSSTARYEDDEDIVRDVYKILRSWENHSRMIRLTGEDLSLEEYLRHPENSSEAHIVYTNGEGDPLKYHNDIVFKFSYSKHKLETENVLLECLIVIEGDIDEEETIKFEENDPDGIVSVDIERERNEVIVMLSISAGEPLKLWHTALGNGLISTLS